MRIGFGVAFLMLGVFCSSDKIIDNPIEPSSEVSAINSPENSADFLVVCSDELAPSAQAFCDYRSAHFEGGSGKCVFITWSSVKTAFNLSGVPALNALLSYCREQWETKPRYVLLLGTEIGVNGIPNVSFAPTLSSSVISDNIFADIDSNKIIDFYVGRIPATSNIDAQNVLEKIRHFEQNPPTRIALAVDDNCQGNGVADYIDFETSYPKIFEAIDTAFYKKDTFMLNSYTEKCFWPDSLLAVAHRDFTSYLNKSDGFVLAYGHSGNRQFTDERILRLSDIAALTSVNMYMFLNGTNSFYVQPCIGVKLLLQQNRGAVAVLGNDGGGAHPLETEFYTAFMSALSKRKHSTIGKTIANVYAENESFEPRCRILLGDPAMKLPE